MKVKDKVFLVTGAGSGIGKELALGLLSRGAKVAIADIREESLKEFKDSNISTHVLDITDRKAVEDLPKNIIAKLGAIDGVINSAGIIQPFIKINDLKYEDVERVMNINFYGTLNITKTLLPHLLKRPEAHIANISSMGGFLPVPGQSVYGASKAAVKLLTEGLYAELRDTNVHVTVIFPGATETNITKNSGLEEMKSDKSFPMLSAKEAAKIMLDGIENNKTRVFTGKDSKLMNLMYRLSPNYATNLIAKQMKSLLDK